MFDRLFNYDFLIWTWRKSLIVVGTGFGLVVPPKGSELGALLVWALIANRN
jgi:hypothetical protein